MSLSETAVRPELLYLVHRCPYPPDKGDRIRTFQMLRHLSRAASIHLACLADEPIDNQALAVLQSCCKRVAVVSLGGWLRWASAPGSLALGRTATEGAFRSSGLKSILETWSATTRFDAALVSSSSMVPYLRLPGLRNVPAVVDLIDVDSQKWFDYAAASRPPRSWLYALEGRRLRALEQALPTWAHGVTLVSEAETALYRGFAAPGGRVQAVGNGVDLDYFRPQHIMDEQGCVFVGALDYRPNVEGACWFCREVWPEIRRRRPDARIALVGRRPVPAVRRLAELPGVEVVGQVPDVRPYLAAAAVVVVPLPIARGVQNKVLEALAMGKATVVSPQALKGLQAREGVHLLCASSPQEWQTMVLNLLADPMQRQRLGSAGQEYVADHHQWEQCLRPMASLLGLNVQEAASAVLPT